MALAIDISTFIEGGYYTFGVITVTIAVYLAIQLLVELNNLDILGKFNMFLSVAFAVISIIFMAISIRNTEWVLLEKGYYWMGLGFVTVTSAMVSATISSILKSNKE